MKFMSSSDESPLEVEETFQEVQGVSRMRGKRKKNEPDATGKLDSKTCVE